MPAQPRKKATGGPVEPGQVVLVGESGCDLALPAGDVVTPACPECFPGGRLPEGTQSGGCEHGNWPPPA